MAGLNGGMVRNGNIMVKILLLGEFSKKFAKLVKLRGNVGNTGTGKLRTGIPVFEIPVRRYEKYHFPHAEVLQVPV